MARKVYAAAETLSLLRPRSFKKQEKLGMKAKKKVAGMEIENSDIGMGDIMLMLDLRKKIINFRKTIVFPHCADSAPIAELIKQTLEDLNQLCPGILPDAKEIKGIPLQQELFYLHEALKSFRDRLPKAPMCSTCSSRIANGTPVGGHGIRKKHKNRRNNVNGARETPQDIKNGCPSAESPRTVPPEMIRNGSFSDVSKSLPPLIKAAKKCISLNIFRTLAGGSSDGDHKTERTEKNLKKAKGGSERIENGVPASPKSVMKAKSSSERLQNEVSASPKSGMKAKSGAARIKNEVSESPKSVVKAKSNGGRPEMEATKEDATSPKSVLNHESNASERIKARETAEASLPLPERPVAPPNVPSKSSNTHEPPRERVAKPPSSPVCSPKSSPPRQPLKTIRTAPIGPPPPPPPAAGGSKLGSLTRSDSKLRRSSHMGNLYRSLKRKLEGSSNVSSPTSTKAKNRIGGGDGNAKQGWAEALAEMARRSAYFLQIEEDVQKHSQMIMELKNTINSFKTKDMAELAKFHGEVEQQLEQLTDETQVLARFEDFPTKKLESLRTAAALHLKLEGIAQELRNWKIEPPLNQLLDKVEKYFSKIKGEIEAMDRTKDEDAKHFKRHDIDFDFKILIKIRELMVDVSSGSMELALQERRKADEARKTAHIRMLWRAFQLAFRVYTFAGGQDDRADRLTRELGRVLDDLP